MKIDVRCKRCGREHQANAWNVRYCSECKKLELIDLRAHYDAIKQSAVTGLCAQQGRKHPLDVCSESSEIAIMSLRKRASDLAERDKVIEEILG